MKFEFKNGKLSISNSPFQNGKICFNCGTFQFDATKVKWTENNKIHTANIHGVEYQIKTTNGELQFIIDNKSANTAKLESITIDFSPENANPKLNAEEWMEHINAFSFERKSGVKRIGLASTRIAPNPSSSMLYLISRRDASESILLSTLPPHYGDYVSFKALHESPHCEGSFGLSIIIDVKADILAGESINSTNIAVMDGNCPLTLLEVLGAKWKKLANKQLKPKLTGWNSWDYFSGAVRSKDIFANCEACDKQFSDKIDYFVIDEGYEPRWGVWDANWKFPEGLDGYCDKIKKNGRKPGVWTAPLLVNTYTDIYLNNPEWFAKTAEGEIATKAYSYGPMAFLDVTHPGAEQFIRETFTRLKSYGFEYFKVDFTQEVLKAESFHDKTAPIGSILRKAFSIIREAIGEESYLLACGAPYESVTGVVDACRTTGDIHNFWGHVLSNAEAMAGKWWMQGTLWNNDPDFLIVRSKETCELDLLNRKYPPRALDKKNYWLAGRELNIREVRTYAQLIRFSGGDIFLSDDIQTLNAKGIEIIRKIMENQLETAARPIDLFKTHDAIPAIWFADSPAPALGIFNWDDNPQEISVDLEKLGLAGSTPVPFWGDERFTINRNTLSANLAPRECAAFSF
jgi:hypothetical protein